MVLRVDVSRLSILILMVLPLWLAVSLSMRIQDWRSAIAALHLRWEREQRQAGSAEVTLVQRQSAQMRFEELVSNRPMTRLWTTLIVIVAIICFAVVLAWELDDLEWSSMWLIAPPGVLAASVMTWCWLVIRSGQQQLAAISMTLYGPPPPRVKVRKIQVSEH